MPAIVLVGAQWGDEGKGKATDLLGSAPTTSSSSTAATTPATPSSIGDEKYALHLLPSGILTPGVNPVIGNGVVVDLEVLFDELEALDARGVDTSKPADQRQRARHHAVPPHPRQGDRALPRQAPDRHDRPRHRPDLRRQDQPRRHPDPGPVRREHPAPEGRGRARPEEPPAGQGLQPPRDRRRRDRRGPARRTPSGCARWWPTRRSLLNKALEPARPSCSRAARRRCSTSTTAPTRSSPPRTRPRAARHRLRRRARPRSTGSSASSRRTRPASARARSRPSCSTSRASGCAPRRRVRHHHRAPPPLRLVRRADHPLRDPRSTASPTSC